MSTKPIDDDDAVIAEMPDLRIEVSHSTDMVILQQSGGSGNEVDRIAIHRAQVRMLAQHFGLLPAPPRLDAAPILARRLRKLHARIDVLGKHLCTGSGDEYAQQHVLATCELGDEFLADLDELLGGSAAGQAGSTPAIRTELVRVPVRAGPADAPRTALPPSVAGDQRRLQV